MELKRTLRTTEDGSKTLYIKDLGESYHSTHGALQEAKHVFIENGLKKVKNSEINILELGFGTGLNTLVTFDEFSQNEEIKKVNYFTLEKYPVQSTEITALGYETIFGGETGAVFSKIHNCPWNEPVEIKPGFILQKFNADFFELQNLEIPSIDLVYFDCFGAHAQPDLWEKPLFEMVADKMAPGALLTTYSSKGSVRRILKELGFSVKKVQGPPGKREMINAIKEE